MKIQKRILAFLTALLLLLPMAGCLVPDSGTKTGDGTGAAADPTASNAAAPSDAADVQTFDPDAIAVELGSTKITAGEIQSMFEQYISYFSYGYDLDAESLGEFLRMSEEYLIEYYLPIWKAEQLGISLSEEQEATIIDDAEAAVEEERYDLLLMFAQDADESVGEIEDASLLTEEQLSAALDGIDAALLEMFGEGYSFDDYLAMRYEDNVTLARAQALADLLKAHVAEANMPGTDEIDGWYDATLEAQKTKYEATPDEFYYDANTEGMLILYIPAGYIRVQVIEFDPEGEPDEAMELNSAAMRALEAEYGALLLGRDNPERRAAIEAEYGKLKEENEQLENRYYGDILRTSAEAYAALNDGLSFEDAMDRYNVKNADGSGFDERCVYVNGTDTHNAGIAKIAKTLQPGTYCEPTAVDGAYVIVKVVEVLPEGVVDRASIEEDIRIAAKEDLTDDVWNDQLDAWLEEAKASAVYHRETYEMLIDLYSAAVGY